MSESLLAIGEEQGEAEGVCCLVGEVLRCNVIVGRSGFALSVGPVAFMTRKQGNSNKVSNVTQ